MAKGKKLTSFQLITCGFFVLILIGTILLMLPVSSVEHGSAPFSDCLFTATSAVCVTGMVVHDTATYWTLFGQIVILVLIQIGGLGVITIGTAFFFLSGRKISIRQRSTMRDSIALDRVGGVLRLTGFLILVSLCIEAAGAVLLLPVFCGTFGLRGIWYSIFHSVTAFCNAGFDLMGVLEPYSSLTVYSGNIYLNLVVCVLIVVGGISFLAWEDIWTKKLNFRKYRLQTKLALITSAVLIVIPAVLFFFLEFNTLPARERFLQSLFQSVTTRTAGFNTADLTEMSGGGRAVTIFLMLVGGSPGSTAGGMKTTTLAVLVLAAVTVFRRKEYVECFGRRIPDSVVRSAIAILSIYLLMLCIGSFVISYSDGIPLYAAVFESASAIGTVGLALGYTPSYGLISKLMMIVMMFFGRVGGLTLIYAFTSPRTALRKLPKETVVVG